MTAPKASNSIIITNVSKLLSALITSNIPSKFIHALCLGLRRNSFLSHKDRTANVFSYTDVAANVYWDTFVKKELESVFAS